MAGDRLTGDVQITSLATTLNRTKKPVEKLIRKPIKAGII